MLLERDERRVGGLAPVSTCWNVVSQQQWFLLLLLMLTMVHELN